MFKKAAVFEKLPNIKTRINFNPTEIQISIFPSNYGGLLKPSRNVHLLTGQCLCNDISFVFVDEDDVEFDCRVKETTNKQIGQRTAKT